MNRMPEIKVSYDPFYYPNGKRILRNSNDAYDIFTSIWNHNLIAYQEEIIAIYLNGNHEVLWFYNHTRGIDSFCPISIKQILAIALKTNARSIIIAHNHPDGFLDPSENDIKATEQLVRAANYFDLNILDHIILRYEEGYYSFKKNETVEGLVWYC